MKDLFIKIFLIVILIVLISFSIFPQAGRGTGRIKGNITDSGNNPLTGARVTLVYLGEGASERTTLTDEEGVWAFIGLGFGKYDVTAEKEGFTTTTRRILVSQVNRNAFINIRLEVSKSEKVKKKLKTVETGLQLFREGNFDEALKHFTEFSSENPQYYQVYLFIGNCHKEKGDYEKAIENYMLVTGLAQKSNDNVMAARGMSGIGEIYVLKKDLEKAQHYFKDSLRMNSEDEILAYNVGEIYFGNNNTDDAIKYYKLAAEIKPEWSIPYLKLGYASLNKGDIKSALDYFNEYLKRDSTSAETETIKEIIKSLKTDGQ